MKQSENYMGKVLIVVQYGVTHAHSILPWICKITSVLQSFSNRFCQQQMKPGVPMYHWAPSTSGQSKIRLNTIAIEIRAHAIKKVHLFEWNIPRFLNTSIIEAIALVSQTLVKGITYIKD